jgi:hypothetical protein
MIHLLDVNVLIALADTYHVHGELALRFFENTAVRDGWATCPLTENGFLRIFGNPKYPNGPGSPEEARRVLKSLLAAPGYRFWSDDISLADGRMTPTLPSTSQLTDCYLLALAAAKGGRFATFDRHINVDTVEGGPSALLILGMP